MCDLVWAAGPQFTVLVTVHCWHHDKSNPQEKVNWGFRGQVHGHHGGKHGGMQASMVLEELRVLRLDPQAVEGDYVILAKWAYLRPQSPPPQWHTSSNKTTPTHKRIYLLIVPLSMTKHSNTWVYGSHTYSNHHVAFPGHNSHNIMQNAFSLTSKSP